MNGSNCVDCRVVVVASVAVELVHGNPVKLYMRRVSQESHDDKDT